MKTLNVKYFGVTILIFRNHVTSLEHDRRTRRWHFPILVNDDHAPICTDTDIRGFKDFGVTSLTFWGHVTSSVSYWWSIETMRLSCTVTEI